ncbi:NADPH-dependent FMN reductase [Pontibacillus salicampi]|uniref:NADPH-dependent FMN reductase n=1 Tax=Pontibacillus salicampi TaxID=1449801 RepID=A0ABV6LLU3_9BACI
MNIVVINGTPRKYGRTRIAAKHIASKVNGKLIDLSTLGLPMFNGEEELNELTNVQLIQETATEADAFIWLSPEYHGGMSGALKNCLDFLNGDHFRSKPTLLFSVAGGGKGGINSLNQMRLIGRALYAHVVPNQMVLDPHCFIREQDTLTEDAAANVQKLLEEFIQFADKMK